MRVRSIYRPGATCVTSHDTLRDAAQKMHTSRQSCLPVVDGWSVSGILTERDVTDAVANGVRPSETPVGAYSNDGGVTVSLNDDCSAAELKMLAIGCRNLPVVDEGRLVGMVSMQDIVLKTMPARMPEPRAVAEQWPDEPPPDADSEH